MAVEMLKARPACIQTPLHIGPVRLVMVAPTTFFAANVSTFNRSLKICGLSACDTITLQIVS